MDATGERDEALMARVAEGNQELLEALVRRHASPLLTFIRRMVGDAHRAEELFQEVVLAVWLKRHQYAFPRPFKPWLYTIALNRCRAEFRAHPRTRSHLSLECDPAMGEGDSPSDRALARERDAQVEQAVLHLPPQQRAVVVLRIWQELPYARIAAILGRTEPTVRSHMHHALANLRRELAPLFEDALQQEPGAP